MKTLSFAVLSAVLIAIGLAPATSIAAPRGSDVDCVTVKEIKRVYALVEKSRGKPLSRKLSKARVHRLTDASSRRFVNRELMFSPYPLPPKAKVWKYRPCGVPWASYSGFLIWYKSATPHSPKRAMRAWINYG